MLRQHLTGQLGMSKKIHGAVLIHAKEVYNTHYIPRPRNSPYKVREIFCCISHKRWSIERTPPSPVTAQSRLR